MPGLTFSNELISRDEGLHTDFACHLYSLMKNTLRPEVILSIICQAVEIEKKFISESLSSDLIGINSKVFFHSLSLWANTSSLLLTACFNPLEFPSTTRPRTLSSGWKWYPYKEKPTFSKKGSVSIKNPESWQQPRTSSSPSAPISESDDQCVYI